jgi:hypothetical protein
MTRRDRLVLAGMLAATLAGGVLVARVGPASAQADRDEAEHLAEKVKDLVVLIRGELGGAETFGAGIIVGIKADRLYVVTANHVVRRGPKQAEHVQIELKSLPGETFEAILQSHHDPEMDLAVLRVSDVSRHKIPVEGLPLDRLGDTAALRRGASVYPLGHPKGMTWVAPVTPDKVAEVTGDHILFESNVLREGHSGGALFTERWELVGMILADQPPYGRALSMPRLVKALQAWNYPVNLTQAARSAAPVPPVPAPAAPNPPSPAATGRLCPNLPDEEDAALIVSGRGKKLSVNAGDCLDVEPGDYRVAVDEPESNCTPGDARVQAGETKVVRLSCTVDVTGRWNFLDGEYLVFRKQGSSGYQYVHYDVLGAPLSDGTAVLERDVLELRGSFLGIAYSARLSVSHHQMQGELRTASDLSQPMFLTR